MNAIERLRVLREAATPGPWRASGPTVWRPEAPTAVAWTPDDWPDEPGADAALIAAAVNSLPALLDVVEEAAAVLIWWETTHGNEFDHDHHCRGADPCTCGWAAAKPALNDGLPAALAALDGES